MKVLVAEDDSVTRHLLKVSLERWNYDVVLAADGSQAADILLGKDSPKLALLDWMMPGTDGVEVCRELRKRNSGSYIYTLLLTARAAREDLLDGLEAGADDYLVKPFDLLELQARLRTGERIIALQDQLIAAREAMREQATHDALTGIWNRRTILEALDSEFSRSQREHSPLTVLMLDLDHFKRINDAFGHQAGDSVLREIASRLQSEIRPYSSVGRYGGEEFLAVVPGCNGSSSFKVAERLRNRVSASPIQFATSATPVTVSVGLACMAEDPNPESLIRRADEALYRAKKAGRNSCEIG
jgi:two-component system, cell cycle response regulator